MKYFSVIGLFILLLITSCEKELTGEGDPDIAQDFLVERFDKVSADGLFKLMLVESDSTYISVQTHQNLIDNMKIYVQNGTLNIQENKSVDAFESYEVYIYHAKPLSKITIRNKVLCQPSGVINQDDLELESNDTAIFDLFEVKTNQLKLYANNKSSIKISGFTKEAKIKAKDNVKVDASDLRCRVLDADLAGDALVDSQIEDEVKGRVLGNSILNYDGNPLKNIEIKDHAQVIKN